MTVSINPALGQQYSSHVPFTAAVSLLTWLQTSSLLKFPNGGQPRVNTSYITTPNAQTSDSVEYLYSIKHSGAFHFNGRSSLTSSAENEVKKDVFQKRYRVLKCDKHRKLPDPFNRAVQVFVFHSWVCLFLGI